MHLLRDLRRGESRLCLRQLRRRAGAPPSTGGCGLGAPPRFHDPCAADKTVPAGAVAEQPWPQRGARCTRGATGEITRASKASDGDKFPSKISTAHCRQPWNPFAPLAPLRGQTCSASGRKKAVASDSTPRAAHKQRLPRKGLEPLLLAEPDPKSGASAISPPRRKRCKAGTSRGRRVLPALEADLTGRPPKLPPDDCCRRPC